MPTTEDYLTQLVIVRNNLVDNLIAKGVAATQTESLTALVPKVLDIVSGGGTQPTLFAPTVISGANNISWVSNTANGNFDVTTTATLNGVTVVSPLSITQEIDGQTLTITSSAENFENVSTTIAVAYQEPSSSVLSINGLNGRAFTIYCDTSSNSPVFTYDGVVTNRKIVAFTQDSMSTNTPFLCTDAGSGGFRCYIEQQNPNRTWMYTSAWGLYSADTAYPTALPTGTVTITDITNNTSYVVSFNATNNESSTASKFGAGILTAGHYYTFNISLSF